jgi:hypothetical protein
MLTDNKNGKLYKIEWSIKDGMLLASDNYKLKYQVKVDTQELGYDSKNEIKANSEVVLTYDEKHSEEIIQNNVLGEVVKIDPVIQKENIIIIEKVDDFGNPLARSNFDIKSNVGITNYKKEYSEDGQTWTTTYNDKVTFFKLSGLYDYQYTIYESKVPTDYIGIEEFIINFENKEGYTNTIKVTNEKEGIGSTDIIEDPGVQPPKTNAEDNYLIIAITSITGLLLLLTYKKELFN